MLYNLPNNSCWINCPLTNDFMVLSLHSVSASHRLNELVLTNVCENYPGWGGEGGILGIWSSKRSTERLKGGRGGAAEDGGYCHSNLYRSWALKSHVAWEGIRITMIRFLFYLMYSFLWLGWVFIAVHGLSLAAVSRASIMGASLVEHRSRCEGARVRGLQWLQ